MIKNNPAKRCHATLRRFFCVSASAIRVVLVRALLVFLTALNITGQAAEKATPASVQSKTGMNLHSVLTLAEPELSVLQWQQVSLGDAHPRLAPLFDVRKLIGVAKPVQPAAQQGASDIGGYLFNPESYTAVEPRLNRLVNRSRIQLLPGSQQRAYFGLLHSHTFSSDGMGDARDAFRMARDVASLDFFAVTDHAEYWWKKSSSEWQRQQAIAREETRADFIALSGFEYSHPVQGHVVVLNSKGWISFLQAGSLQGFFDWLATPQQSEALAIFAHPGFHTYRNWFDLRHFKLDSRVRQHFVGVETIHKNVWRKSLRGYGGRVSHLDEALSAGWWLGPLASQDNHTPSWGVADHGRIAVLLDELSKESLLSALSKRRFYSTQSPQLQLALGLYDARGLRGQMGDSLNRDELSEGEVFLRLRILEPNPLTPPQRIEFLINGRLSRELTFLDNPSPANEMGFLAEKAHRSSWLQRLINNGLVTVSPFETVLNIREPAEPEIFDVHVPVTLLPCPQKKRPAVASLASVVVRFYQGDRGQYMTQTSPLTVVCR
ncbi:MAG: hypothetical protein RLZZ488_1886 [Pseudomonadota bacterium]